MPSAKTQACQFYAVFMPFLCRFYANFMPFLCRFYSAFIPFLFRVYSYKSHFQLKLEFLFDITVIINTFVLFYNIQASLTQAQAVFRLRRAPEARVLSFRLRRAPEARVLSFRLSRALEARVLSFRQLCFRKYFSENIFPKIFFRNYFSENIFPKLFFRKYFSENIFPKPILNPHQKYSLKTLIVSPYIIPNKKTSKESKNYFFTVVFTSTSRLNS